MTQQTTPQQTIDRATRGAAGMLEGAVRGEVLVPGSTGYEEARHSWHRTVDPHPAVVVDAADSADIQQAVRVARDHGLPFAVQGTGHGTLDPADGGLLVRTSLLRHVEVDPLRRTARVGPGTLWSDVIVAGAPYQLAPVSGMTPSVGVVGYTLGGGAGWLSRAYGFAADGLQSADVVTADGLALTVDRDEHPDLYWALRGGGPGFAAVTAMELDLHRVGRVYAGMRFFPATTAPAALARYREWAPAEPNELNTGLTLMGMPDAQQVPEPLRGRRVLALRVFSLADAEETESTLAPLLDGLGAPLLDGIGTMRYPDTAQITGPAPPPAAVAQHFELFEGLPDGLVDLLLQESGEGAASPLSALEVRHWGGAMAASPADAGPAGHRQVPYSVLAATMLDGPLGRETELAYMDHLADRVRPYAHGGTFLNFLTDSTRTETAFTPENYRRLRAVKRDWDPEEFFALGHTVPPAVQSVPADWADANTQKRAS